ncbi:dipeptide/oligopeptide/nickel ABC transporter permease/ATP-binding protein [Celeribacter indicus]|uniref:Oligopeptide/dipeptide ABC transporter ATP-binding protein n=1 Tax=Celeribacter indicus TaxID=1208324 RepID=A0A0B5DWW7_9RHOB|nr:dipeptide/oligopeptide/nickel ABC transporter permease/ATP-binding protein [Celeribacter indicus]AJE47529.1 oligopeptide/dipeptide ABC transporter ATP-binding protein [Celeribacter indicus]SDW09340.1 peptide/nickel transport system permease protein [Celeribacter indicus]
MRISLSSYFAAVFLLAIVSLAVLAPVLPMKDPVVMDVLKRFAGPSSANWLGNDAFGRDVFARIVHGARASLSVAVLAALASAAVGVVVGLIAGYFRGWIELAALRPMDIILSFPPMLLALLTVALVGPGTVTLTLLLSILFVPTYARITYGETLSVRNLEYVDAARALGHGHARIMFRTVLPNVAGPVFVQFSLVVAACIVLESGLSFLGLGVTPPNSSWGLMIRDARPHMGQNPMGLIWPCLALVLTVWSVNRLCDQLRDVLDPRGAVKLLPAPGLLRRWARALPQPERRDNPEGRLLDVDNISTEIRTARGTINAVDGVSLVVNPGEVIALVGESGSGKSVTGFSIMQLLPYRISRVTGGSIHYSRDPEGHGPLERLDRLPPESYRQYRGNEIAMVFQEPMACLNPVYTVGRQLAEAIRAHDACPTAELRKRSIAALADVGIPDPARRIEEYPHQLSGGMRQRVALAIALCGNPRLLIADEPTTALDVTVQAQILELLDRIRRERNIGLIFITHDLGVVAQLADRVVVMYCGQVVEDGSVEEIFYHPRHPYTRGLLDSVPKHGELGDKTEKRLLSIRGTVPSPFDLPSGCRYAPRCDFARPACDKGVPVLETVEGRHTTRCRRWKDIAL